MGPPPLKQPWLELTHSTVPSGTAWVKLEGWDRVELVNPCMFSPPGENANGSRHGNAGGSSHAGSLLWSCSSGSISKIVPHGSSIILVGRLIAVMVILLLSTAMPYLGDELMTPEEMAVPWYPSCPSTGSIYGWSASANGEPTFGVCPAGVPMESSDGDSLPLLRVILCCGGTGGTECGWRRGFTPFPMHSCWFCIG